MSAPEKRWPVPAAAAVVLALLAVDIARALEAGIADSGLAFFAPSACLGVAVALTVGRRPERRRIALLILLWIFVGVLGDVDWDWQTSRLAATLAVLSFGLQGPTYAHMLLAYPSGSIRDRGERFLLITAYVAGLSWIAFPLLFADPRRCGQSCLPRVPSLLYTGVSFDLRPVGQVFDVVLAALGMILVALFARRVRNTPRGARRTQLPLVIGGVYAAAVFIVARSADLGNIAGLSGLLDWLDRLNSLLIPLAILTGIAMINAQRGLVGNLVVKLATAPAGGVRDALAESLGDPTLELALWVPGMKAFVDEAGTEVNPLVPGPGRAITLIGPNSEPLAALTHDESLLGQRALIEAAGSAATLALENARLQAELRAQVAELRASRTRIVTAADAERRRLERDLHDGAQQRLLAVGLALQLIDRQDPNGRDLLREAEAELQQALAELRALARGIHPAVLTEQGLAGGIRSLADRSPCAVKLDLDEHRHTPAVEAAAYFVISEALANTAKHSAATEAHVAVRNSNSHLLVEITDNGNGGASLTRGGGLEGLADRVGALNGNLTIQSTPQVGTTIRAEIPCAPS